MEIIFFQAEGISKYAKQIFEALREEPQHSELKEFSQNKRRPSKKSEDGQRRTSPRVSPKPAGMETCSSLYNLFVVLTILTIMLYVPSS